MLQVHIPRSQAGIQLRKLQKPQHQVSVQKREILHKLSLIHILIEDALRICRNFVTSFGTDFQNLFLYGDVGVGKTFLSNCIAKELMDKEYSVLYFSASKFFSSLAKHAFDKQDVDAQNMFCLLYTSLASSIGTGIAAIVTSA